MAQARPWRRCASFSTLGASKTLQSLKHKHVNLELAQRLGRVTMIRPLIPALSVTALLMMACSPVAADEAAMKKYRNYLPEQIAALPQKVRQSEVPMAYLLVVNGANSELGQRLFAGMLNVLMYKGMGDYDAAVRAFQKDLGDEPTGKLTVWQIWQLQQRSEMQGLKPPFIPGFFTDIKVEGYARVQGTLQLLEEKAAFPVNKVKLECAKHEGSCTLDEIDVEFPKETDWAAGFAIYWTGEVQYKITNWTDDVIEATYEPSGLLEKPCRDTKLQLNFKAKEYYMITTNAGGECEFMGQKLGKLDKPRISRIVAGQKLIDAENEAFRQRQFDLLASEYRDQVTGAVERAKAAEAASVSDRSP
jgi:hypothetical protein